VGANGDVDELNSTIGVAMAMGLEPRLAVALLKIQNELFHLGSDLAFPADSEFEVPRIEAHIAGRLPWRKPIACGQGRLP
jgi:cob(I)alamin adenosyltransferase